MQGRLLPMAALLVMSGSAALADTPAQARKAIEGIYAKDRAAMARKDVDTVFANQAPDYVAISKAGKRVPREQANQIARQLTMAKTVDVKSRILSFALKGDTAVARLKTHIHATIMNPQTNQPMAVTMDGLTEDTWVKRGGKWLIKQMREIQATQKFTGMK